MKKEQLIKKITDVVMKNSKKGVLTTTKYVGTYNYKSGYDSYFAVSLDLDKTLIVYSYYQNDRGEHIDTCKYKLIDLPEKELQEIYNNLNTEDEDSLSYVGWTETEEKNLAILVELGLFKPKKTEYKPIDINKVPDLENQDDAYYIDRDENVHILKCVGKTIIGNPIFDVEKNRNGIYEQPYYLDKPDTFCKQAKHVRNKGIFMAADGDDISDDKYLYVPNKKELAKLLKKQMSYKDYYFVNTMLESWKRTTNEKPENRDGRFDFTDKDEAIAKFNEVRNELLANLKDAKSKLEKKKEKIKEFTKGIKLLHYDECHIWPKNAVVGSSYYVEMRNDKGKYTYVGPFKVKEVQPEREYAVLEDGRLVYRSTMMITPENLEAYNASCKYEKVMDMLKDIDTAMKYVERAIKFAETVKPFIKSDQCIPKWVVDDALELYKKPLPKMKHAEA